MISLRSTYSLLFDEPPAKGFAVCGLFDFLACSEAAISDLSEEAALDEAAPATMVLSLRAYMP